MSIYHLAWQQASPPHNNLLTYMQGSIRFAEMNVARSVTLKALIAMVTNWCFSPGPLTRSLCDRWQNNTWRVLNSARYGESVFFLSNTRKTWATVLIMLPVVLAKYLARLWIVFSDAQSVHRMNIYSFKSSCVVLLKPIIKIQSNSKWLPTTSSWRRCGRCWMSYTSVSPEITNGLDQNC